MRPIDAYYKLLKKFGKQDWWPVKRNFIPKEWEICLGAVLTQNTNWNNVEKALDNLAAHKFLTPKDILGLEQKKLEKIIRSSGFYKQKAVRLRELAKFVTKFGSFENFRKNVRRDELLGVKGIGFETADSILLYACRRPYFVVDAYTKRFVRHLGWDKKFGLKMDYESLREFFEENLPKNVSLYKEFHALIVEWGKRVKKIYKSINIK
ncbi:MAG: endonuclease [Candidatus Aenigmarchaeota archaeon]|nr:endonuclease [Candidatus Aenigmarchaeota archaeon]